MDMCGINSFCLRRWLAAVVCLLLAQSHLRAQTAGQLDPTFGASLGLNSRTNVMVRQPDGKLLVGGSFTKGILRLNADGSVDTSFNPGVGANSFLHAIALAPDGKIVIGGEFLTYAGVSRRKFARLNADGSLDTTFDPGTGATGSANDGEVLMATVQSDGQVIIGGLFNAINGTPRNYLARLRTDGSLDTTYNPTLNSSQQSLSLLSNGQLYLQGGFTTVNGVVRRNLARLNTDGSLDTSFNPAVNVTNIQSFVLQADGKVLAGCYLASGGSRSYFVARLDGAGKVDPSFTSSPIADFIISNLLVQPNDGRIVIGGSFNNISGTAHHHMARLNTDGTLDSSFDTGTITDNDCTLCACVLNGDILYLSVPGSPGCVHANGSQNVLFKVDPAPGPDAICYSALPDSSGNVLIGGNFVAVSGVPDHGIARLLADGTPDAAFAPAVGVNGPVLCEAIQPDGRILAGGNFSTASGATRTMVARFYPDGSLDPTFTTGDYSKTGGAVQSMTVLANGSIVIAGPFSHYGLIAQAGGARLLPDGTLDTAFSPGTILSGGALAVAVQSDGRMIFGGAFSNTASGGTVNRLVRLNANGGVDTTFNVGSGPDNNVTAVVMQGNNVLVGGLFSTFNGTSKPFLVRLLPDGTLDPTFNPSGSGPTASVQTITLQPDGKILIGGLFNSYNGVLHPLVARLNADGTPDPTFVSAGSYVGSFPVAKAVVPQSDGRILVSGSFITIGGVVRNYIARLNANGTLDPTFNPGVGNPSVSALAFQPNDGNVIVGGAFTTAGNQPANALARLRTDGSLDTSFVAPFSPGDSVQTLARQPADGNVVAAALLSSGATSGSFTPASHLSGEWPRLQSKVKNPIVRCLFSTAGLDPGFNASAGTDGVTNSLGVQTDGKIVVGGSYTQLNATTGHPNLGRLNADGTLDTAFAATTNAAVNAVALQTDGKIVIGGVFTQANGTARTGLARLLTGGGLDPAFSAAAGSNGTIAALKLQADGKIVAGGTFTTAGGGARSCLARFSSAGVLDAAFDAGTFVLTGGTAVVSSIDQQADGKLIVAGDFSQIAGYTRNRVARLNTDGSVDTTYDPGTGPNASVHGAALQPDGKTLIGGDFATVDNAQHNAAARLLGDYSISQYPVLSQWRIANFGQEYPTGNAADTAAPYGDGVTNLDKYALNLNPLAADATAMTVTGTKGLPLLGKDATGQYLTLTFVRRKASTTPGITYSPQFASSPASSAFVANAQATSVVTAIDTTWERVTVTDSVSLLTQPARFARLVVTNP